MNEMSSICFYEVATSVEYIFKGKIYAASLTATKHDA